MVACRTSQSQRSRPRRTRCPHGHRSVPLVWALAVALALGHLAFHAAAARSVSAESPATTRVHTVAWGETLWSIAQLYGITVEELMQANGITNPDLLQAGQVLTIPSATAGASKPAPASTLSEPRKHTVKQGETLYHIATFYGVGLEELARANGIANPNLIVPGQELVIPATTGQDSAGARSVTGLLPAGSAGATGGALGFSICPVEQGELLWRAASVAGASWVRVPIRWAAIEPQQGSYDWSAMDALVNAAGRYGLSLLVTVTGSPAWAARSGAEEGAEAPPAHPTSYAALLGAMAARYGSAVGAYEIWSEPNVWHGWGGHGQMSPKEYLSLLQASYTAVKSAAPQSLVLLAGMAATALNDGWEAFSDLSFLAELYSLGASPYFDAVAVHYPGFGHAPAASPSPTASGMERDWAYFLGRYRQLRALMALNGDGHKPIWFTELGWPVHTAGFEPDHAISESEQALYLSEALRLLQAEPFVSAIFVNNLNCGPALGAADARAAFSLFRPDGTPRPAYVILARGKKTAYAP